MRWGLKREDNVVKKIITLGIAGFARDGERETGGKVKVGTNYKEERWVILPIHRLGEDSREKGV